MTDVFHELYMFSLSVSYVNLSVIFVWLHGRQNISFFFFFGFYLFAKESKI